MNDFGTEEIFCLLAESAKEICQNLQSHEFCRADTFSALGVDSVDKAEIVMMVMEKMELQVPRVELFGPTTIGELVDLLYAKKCEKCE